MHIKKASYNDLDKIKSLWRICFDDTEEFIDFFFTNRYNSDNTLCVFKDNRIASCLQLLPYKLFLRGKIFNTSYIVGVATLPEYRGRGYAKELLHYALYQLNRDKIPISILLPFNYGFYNKYGWAICYEYLKYIDINNKNIYFKNKNNSGIDIREVDIESDMDILDRCYKAYMRSYNGYIYRSEDDWYRLWTDCRLEKGSGYICSISGEPLGYFMHVYDNKKIHIRELIYLSIEAKEALLVHALNLNHTYGAGNDSEAISWNAPLDDLTYLNMSDSRGHLMKDVYVMGRINNIINALEGLKANIADCSLQIRVKDPFYKENDSVYRLNINNGNINITERDVKKRQSYDIALSINTLSQILWGYITPFQAFKQGLINTELSSMIQKLELIFPKTYPYIIEDY